MIEIECPYCKIHHFLYPNEIETLARDEKVEINCKCGKKYLVVDDGRRYITKRERK